MKCTLAIAALLLPLSLLAQDSLKKKNEIGLFAESYSSRYTYGQSINTLGITYKHHTSDFLTLVLTAGQTNYSVAPWQSGQPINFDTLTWRNIHTGASMATIGVAVEAQRKFYKRFSLYAGAELRAAYGKGNYDTVLVTQYKISSPNPHPGAPAQSMYASINTYQGPEVSIMQTNILPYIGIKVNFGRFNVGYMLSSYMFQFQNQSSGAYTYGTFNFSLGNTSQRFFLTYRFR